MATRTLTVTVPLPPSVNNLFATVTTKGGRFMRASSKEYQAWRVEAGYARWERVTEDARNRIRWRCAIVAYGLAEASDVDNIIKPTIDLVCLMTGLRDCAPLRFVSAERSDEVVSGRAYLRVTIEMEA